MNAEQIHDLREWVALAGERDAVREAVGRVYAELEGEIALRRPLCVMSGRCCRFDEYGHRLYVTTLELATFAHELKSIARAKPEEAVPGVCPFQRNKLCTVHAIRPMGCRLFFCDASSTQWQQDRYERFHGDLKRLHGELEVPYVYMEWREALEALSLGEGLTPNNPETHEDPGSKTVAKSESF